MLRILIVDDKKHAQAQVAHVLAKLGYSSYEIVWAETISQLKNVDQQMFDLAFIDFFLSNDQMFGTERS